MSEEYTIDELKRRIVELESELEDEKKNNNVCNRCGRVNKSANLDVKEEVLQAYFRSLLGQAPFSHTFESFGGRLKVTCVAQQGNALIERHRRKDTISGHDMETLIACTVSSIDVTDPVSGYTRTIYSATPEQLVDAVKNPTVRYEELLLCVDSIKLAIVKNACRAFTVLVLTLIDKADSEDFYEGAGLV